MNEYSFEFSGAQFLALPQGALFWPTEKLLAVSDLHLGKSDRIARRSGLMLPPYETAETLAKLAALVKKWQPQTVICLGDSFDDLQAVEALSAADTAVISQLQAGRQWLWLEGNHDPGPLEFGGTHLSEFALHSLTFRHIASKDAMTGEISGHYHPKTRLKGATRPCFLYDTARMVLPAFGHYTGGLQCNDPVLRGLFPDGAMALLTGKKILPVPISNQARQPQENSRERG